MSQPLVSVIVPCHNAQPTIAATLKSCQDQTHGNLEIIVVDNNSTDATIEVAKRAGCKLNLRIVSCLAQGVSNARNTGLSASTGDYVQWLDADDTLGSDKIARQVQTLASTPAADIAYGDWTWRFHLPSETAERDYHVLQRAKLGAAYGNRQWTYHDGAKPIAELNFVLTDYKDMVLRMLEDKWLPPHAYLLRRSACARLRELSLFDPLSKLAEDRQYFTAATLIGLRFAYVPGSSAVYHAWSSTQMTSRATPLERAKQLKRIFAWLRSMSKDVPLSAEHCSLLDSDRDHWVLSDSAIAPAPATRAHARVIDVLRRNSEPATLESHAKIVAYSLPGFWERHTHVIRLLNDLTSTGGLIKIRTL